MVINKSRLSLNVKEQNDDFLYGRLGNLTLFPFHEIGFSCFCL